MVSYILRKWNKKRRRKEKIQNYRSELETLLLEIRELLKKSNKNLSKLKTVPDYHVYISYSNTPKKKFIIA